MSFFRVRTRYDKKANSLVIYPQFIVAKSDDHMIRGHAFYAIWDDKRNLWSKNEYDVVRVIDEALLEHAKEYTSSDVDITIKLASNFDSGVWNNYKTYLKNSDDNYEELDSRLMFLNSDIRKSDYATKTLPYALCEGPCDSYEELMSVLYSDEERRKIEWAIGSIIAGDSKSIQKLLVLYGEAGAGKSTVLNIIQKLFDGYYIMFDAQSITSSSSQFSLEQFKSNPLVAIQHDGDLSKIEDNTRLNSIVSHEQMVVNEKFKTPYVSKFNAFLFVATNRPVRITDAKSGILRRLIDVSPSGEKVPPARYEVLVSQIDNELGCIATHCLNVYKQLGKNYYSTYVPLSMVYKTDVFFNYVEEYMDIFKKEDYITLKQAYTMYKDYCEESFVERKMPMYKFREELKNYFEDFSDRKKIDGLDCRGVFEHFKYYKFETPKAVCPNNFLRLDCTTSLLDEMLSDCKAQYATASETPSKKWGNVTTTLKDLNTHKIHYVKVPDNHIVIDFDLKDSEGNKSAELNLAEAAKWPETYAEFSKGGAGVHLHYLYSGDVNTLSRVYSEGIEIKVFTGGSALRRKLTKCNDIPVATISTGLPLKETKMLNYDIVTNEKGIRSIIIKNLKKEIHPGTKPSIDFIFKILEDAYNSGTAYDVTDLRQKVLLFAINSTNHSDYCMQLVNKMHFKSEEPSVNKEFGEERLVFFDIEVFPNLFLVNWKYADADSCTRMVNPTPQEVEQLFKYKLVGFNCRRYDNHLLYACYLGYSNAELYHLSQEIINGGKNCMFGEAYNISYADVYDFSNLKQSLKKFEIDLGIHHQELGLPWNEPVPEDKWDLVAEYCDNDVMATEAVFNNRKMDFLARQVLADITGMTVNNTTQQITAKLIFGEEKHPQEKFVYTDLSTLFPGYSFDHGVSSYRGENPGEGGYVYAEPGMYTNVALLDVASMHPTSIIQLNLFGPYTERFAALKQARLDVKHSNFDKAAEFLGEKAKKYLTEEYREPLAYALKIVINSIYGLTAAKFDNKFRDSRNIDNIVAKRGALFMINLKHEVQERGFTVAHIKTDSIKIPNATPDIIQFVMDYGRQYGYEFEHEATYERMCLINDAVYIAKTDKGNWTATGAQFQVPYVFKMMFTKEPLVFEDLCETKTVTSALYLDMNEDICDKADSSSILEELSRREYNHSEAINSSDFSPKKLNPMYSDMTNDQLKELEQSTHNLIFVGKASSFCPIKPGCGGGLLLREHDGKFYAATGTKGYRWLESETVKNLGKESDIDLAYFDSLVDSAAKALSKFGDLEWFLDENVSSNN